MIKGNCNIGFNELQDLAGWITKMLDKERKKICEGYYTYDERQEMILNELINSGLFEAPND